MRCNSEKRRAFSLIDLLLAVALLGAVLAFLIEAGRYLASPSYLARNVCFTSDGGRYAGIDSIGSHGNICVWQCKPRRQLMKIPGPLYDYLDHPIAISAHGRKLTFFDYLPGGDYVSLWNIDTQTQVFRRNLSVQQLEFSPDERALACLLKDGTIDVLNTQDGRLLYKLSASSPTPCTAITWSPDGKQIAGRLNGEIFFWNTDTGNPGLSVINVDHSPDYRTTLAFSPNGKYLAVGTYYFPSGGRMNKSRIDLFDVATKNRLGAWEQPEQSFYRLAFLQQGEVLAVGTEDLHFLEVPDLDSFRTVPTVPFSDGPWAINDEQVVMASCDAVYGVNLKGEKDDDVFGIYELRSRHGLKSFVLLPIIGGTVFLWQLLRAFRRQRQPPAVELS